jgi:diaminohydroxyphosphoribosylaminopyrimidine deaminase/5-amino-6-(5-phosphoribosylamino)uracil reductase
VLVKLALSRDGLIPKGTGQPLWLSGPESTAYAHLLRARSRAIMVGSGTVAADNPDLRCRLPGLGWASPNRLVLDSRLQLPVTSKLVGTSQDVPVWALTAPGANAAQRAALADRGVEIIDVAQRPGGGADLPALLHLLAEKGINRLMVEGGPTLAGQFIETGADEIHIVTTPTSLSSDQGLLPFGDRPLATLTGSQDWRIVGERPLGADRLRIYARV